MSTRSMWSNAQLQAFVQLIQMGEVFFEVNWPDSPIKPRLDPLIVGPTGVGKSHVVRAVAEALKVPLLRLSYGEWMVGGSRGSQPTLSRVHDFVVSCPRGIIHIDEVDKARVGFQSDWSIYAYAEMFFLLDRNMGQPSRNEKWSEALNAKLKNCFWIVGSGTWQMLWDGVDKPAIGFDRGRPTKKGIAIEIARLVHRKEIIPKELLKRFCNELILIPPATEEDFMQAAETFGLRKLANELAVELDFRNAVESGGGARWLEETYGALLLQAYRTGRADLLQLRPTPDEVDEEFTEEEAWVPVTE